MSEVWNAHYKRIQDLINANPVARYVPPAPAPVAPALNMQELLAQMGIVPEMWQGGGNQASDGVGQPGNLGDLAGGLGISAQGVGGMLGALGGGLVGGPVGGLLGNLAGRGIAGLLGSIGGDYGGANDPSNAGSATGGSANSAAAGYGGGYGTGFEGWGGL